MSKKLTPAERKALEDEAERLVGCTEGSPEEARLKEIADLLEPLEE